MVSKKIFSVIALLLFSVLLTSFVSAVPVTIDSVELDNDELNQGSANPLELDRATEWELKVRLEAIADGDIEVEARIDGYEYNNRGTRIFDATDVFHVTAGRDYIKRLSLTLPRDMEDGTYWLKIRVSSKASPTLELEYELAVEMTGRHSLHIEDIIFSPEYGVKAGRALLTTVRIENDGQGEEEGIKVRISIPELEVAASDYLDSIDKRDEESSEELYLRIPADAQAGEYVAEIEITYDNGYETLRETRIIKVLAGANSVTSSSETNPTTEGKTTINVGPTTQDVTAGQSGVIYPVVLTNSGSSTKTYTVSVELGSWGEAQVNPSNLAVLEAGESKAVYVYVSAKANAPAGEQLFALTIKSGDEVLKQVTLKANVVADEAAQPNMSSIKRGLEIGLIVLVVLLVILGLIIGFNKLKGSEEDEDEELGEGQTYY